jgi:quercetin dioxygenase-like cupin family protein
MCAHQPGEDVFDVILPEHIEWKPFAALPPATRLAVLIGDPGEEGPYVIRVKLPAGEKLMLHRHPEDCVYTVMSGVLYVGFGELFDGDQVKPYPPGTVLVLPGDTWHFHWAKSGDYVIQVTAPIWPPRRGPPVSLISGRQWELTVSIPVWVNPKSTDRLMCPC